MRGVRLLALGLAALPMAGCALPSMPGWMPFSSNKPAPASTVASAGAPKETLDTPKPGDVRQRPVDDNDETVTDRVIAVVNNDAITLGELQEAMLLVSGREPGPLRPAPTRSCAATS